MALLEEALVPIYLFHRYQLEAAAGDVGELDVTSLSSLTAGNVAATGGISKILREKDFTASVRTLLDAPALAQALGRAARDHVRSAFDPQHAFQAIVDHWRDVAERRVAALDLDKAHLDLPFTCLLVSGSTPVAPAAACCTASSIMPSTARRTTMVGTGSGPRAMSL